ncbi:protein eiger isoform X1 [Drosophila virilis]|uniref:protein eiger isoform X1 n=1 Tax=Drosophila virilis TaxID=7244 RepID=UPI00139653F9|nr:protein eiger isoform X1 [Drosophila virilis]
MTAETLKPFITPTSAVNNFPAKQSGVTHSGSKRKTRQLIPIILSIVALVLVAGILILTIWQTIRVQQLDTDLASLRREVDSLRQRLGINYLEDLAEFQKEYTNLLIHDPNKLDDLEGEEDDNEDDDDDDDDEDDVGSWVDSANVDEDDDEDEDAGNERTDYDEYLDLIKQETDHTRTTVQGIQDGTETAASVSDSAAASGSTSAASNDDNVFDDFTSYNDSKKKKERNRKTRSIAELRNELQSNDLAQIQNNQSQTDPQINKSAVTSDSTTVQQLRRQRPRVRQGRQRLLVRKGESPVSAKSADYNAPGGGGSLTVAAHFHLNRKVPHHQAPIRLHSYEGDMYMGHATASSDNQWQQHFSVNNGILTVHQPGLYYVYAQICYNNTHDQNGFIIFHGHNAFLQCLNTVPTHIDKIHTCHTSGLIQLQKEESIHLRDIHRDRNVMLRDISNRSYFGIIKI